MKENTFLSKEFEFQEDHEVITTGSNKIGSYDEEPYNSESNSQIVNCHKE